MSKNTQMLEDAKLDIRSILLAAQKGLTLQKFLRDYREIVGYCIPYRELGFPTPVDLLKHIPEVVNTIWVPELHDYLLTAVADEKTSHIEKMVAKQKTSKTSLPLSRKRLTQLTNTSRLQSPVSTYVPPHMRPSRSLRSSHSVAPRFQKTKAAHIPFLPADVKQEINQLLRDYPDGIMHQNFLLAYKQKFGKELKYNDMGFYTLHECLGAVSGLQFNLVNGEQNISIPSARKKPTYKVPEFEAPVPDVKSGATYSSQGTRIPNVSQQTVEKVPLLETPNHNDNLKSSPYQKLNTSAEHSRFSFSAASEFSDGHRSDILDVTETYEEEYDDRSGISETMKKNFKKILQMNPHGIWAADFPRSYEEMTGHKFNLSELGYFSLVELANALPDIFKRVRPAECKSDWLLFDASAAEDPYAPSQEKSHIVTKQGIPYIEEVVSNIRKILEGYPEGIYVDDVVHLYALNCESPLILNGLGYSSAEKFLLSIANRVPLKFDYSSARKKVRLGFCISPVFVHPNISSSKNLSEKGKVVPKDAILPGVQYELQVIPSLSDPSGYIPVTAGTVVDPDHMWIQLVGNDTSEVLYDLMEKLDYFYNSSAGDNYTMLDCHIIVGTIAAGIWAGDAGWHRISIIGMSCNPDFVDASFVDYGTRGKIKKTDLRYLKKEFLTLPAQAIKAYMAFVKPVGGKWNSETHDWLMKHLRDKTVMAEIVKPAKHGEPVCVWLCDCSNDEDKFLNLMLVQEGLAVYSSDNMPETTGANHNKPVSFQEKLRHYESSQETSFPAALKDVSPVDFAKVLSTLSQSQSTPFNNQLLLEWILRLANENGNGGSGEPMNGPLLQQLLNSGFDLSTAINLLSFLTSNYPSKSPLVNNPPNISNSSYVSPYSENSLQNVSTGISAYSNASFGNPVLAAPSAVRTDILFPSSKSTARPLSDFGRNTELQETPTPVPHPSNNYYIQPPRSSGKHTDVVKPVPCVATSDSESDEIFQDDEEDLEKLYNQYGIARRRFVLRVNLKDGYKFHTVIIESAPYVSCGDVSKLLWNSEDSDCLSRRLRGKDIVFTTLTIYDTDYPEVFHQLRCCKVNGIKESDQRSAIVLYSLRNVIDILNIFGHPSKTIRAEITREINRFNPADELWENFSGLDISDEENSTGTTDSDKFKRMCIFDLRATLEGLRFKRLKIMSGLTDANNVDPKDIQEVRKIEEQFQVYQKRIKEIEAVCK